MAEGQAVKGGIVDALTEYVHPGSGTTPAQLASKISKLPFDPADNGKYGENFFWSLWGEVVGAVQRLPHDHPVQDKIIWFMRELTLLPDAGVTVWDSPVWSGLPVLNAELREGLNATEPDATADREQWNQGFVSFNAFIARLWSAGVTNTGNSVVWMLRDILEEDPPGNVVKEQPAVDPYLMSAAVHIEYAGQMLLREIDRKLDEREQRSLRGGTLFGADKSGVTDERWRFWIKRFREVAEKAKTEEARNFGLRAARLMEIWKPESEGQPAS